MSHRFLDRYASSNFKTSRHVGVWRLSQVLHSPLYPQPFLLTGRAETRAFFGFRCLIAKVSKQVSCFRFFVPLSTLKWVTSFLFGQEIEKEIHPNRVHPPLTGTFIVNRAEDTNIWRSPHIYNQSNFQHEASYSWNLFVLKDLFLVWRSVRMS